LNKKRPFHKLRATVHIAVLLTFMPFLSGADTDSLSTRMLTWSQTNLEVLDNLYCWHGSNYSSGHYRLKTSKNVQNEFEDLNLLVFTNFIEETELFYRYLDQLETDKKKKLVRYFSFYEKEFETAFEKNGLPADLKYMAPALSMMNPKAVSKDHRAGTWQLTHFQAVLNGLYIDELVDERFDISRATYAAAKQIKNYREQFESVELAVAAYLYGNVTVRNAVYFAVNEGKTITGFLPKNYKEQLAAFQAMALFMNNNRIVPDTDLFSNRMMTDSVKVNRRIHLQQITDVLGIPLNELQFLNPEYKFSIVPGNARTSKIYVPKGKWDDFVLWQDSIYRASDSLLFQPITKKIEYPPSPNQQYAREPVKDLEIEGKTKIRYRIKTGDVLGIIAEIYDVRVADLKYWNNIFNERRIQAGKYLDIFVDDDKADYYRSLADSSEKNKTENISEENNNKTRTSKDTVDLSKWEKIEHVVKSGESPYTIAKKYKDVTPEEILEWNNIRDARKIQIGQKLIVYLK